LLPVLKGTGIAMWKGTRVGGTGSSVRLYHKLSQELHEDMERVANSLVALQNLICSLAAVSLQNRLALSSYTVEKIGTCILLGEECCYFVNQSGVITAKVRELRERIQRRQQK
ncbi:SYCY1 protein, partial [Crocuta crocuta]